MYGSPKKYVVVVGVCLVLAFVYGGWSLYKVQENYIQFNQQVYELKEKAKKEKEEVLKRVKR
ncbi:MULTISPECIES: hypothetical protein [Bacillus amyloliquefaciens group]|uniref:hypothetical protein n=1 Tax=Bacillus amyloliquefaciens group TaxID=1938374 RepID=UPI00073B1480|nr:MULTISPECIES: hypothetical protein [Bacillus amyloliquefaciens group]KTF59051.1 hypothetical protein AR691_17360 [Bacillus amyloliquefaciens]